MTTINLMVFNGLIEQKMWIRKKKKLQARTATIKQSKLQKTQRDTGNKLEEINIKWKETKIYKWL